MYIHWGRPVPLALTCFSGRRIQTTTITSSQAGKLRLPHFCFPQTTNGPWEEAFPLKVHSHIIHPSSIALMQEHHVPELNVQKTVLKSLSLLMNVHWRDGEQLPSMQSTPILQDAIMDCNLAHRQDGWISNEKHGIGSCRIQVQTCS